MKFMLIHEGFFKGNCRFMYAEHLEKSFALYRENYTVPIYLPTSACKVHRLKDGRIQLQIPHWLHVQHKDFFDN